MALSVYLYNNTKRLKSTKEAPTYNRVLDCVLKDNTSLLNPVIRIKDQTRPDENYFKILDRYYWVTNVTSLTADLWEITGEVDPLTTFRSSILGTPAFILYDSTPNTQLPDPRLAIETDCDVYTATANMPWSFSSGLGTYLIATTGNTDELDLINLVTRSNDRIGTGVYTIPQNQLRKLGFDIEDWRDVFQTLWNAFSTEKNRINTTYFVPGADTLATIQNFISGWAYTAQNAIDYITGFFRLFASNILGSSSALSNIKASYWLPFEIPGTALRTPTAAHSNHLALGNYTDIVSGLMEVADPVITSINLSVDIPWHFTDWRNAACTEVMLYIPLIGCINIPSDVVKGHNTLDIKIALNLYSGALAVEVLCGGAQIGTFGASCSMPILIGDSNINTGDIVNTLGAAVTKNYLGAGTNAIMSFNEMVSSVGGLGGGAGVGLSDKIVCICRVHETSQDPSALINTIGTPTHQLKTLATSLGYVQCLNAQVVPTADNNAPYATKQELDMINSALNSGLYLE